MLAWLGLRRGNDQKAHERRVYERHQLSPDSTCRVIVTMGRGSWPVSIHDISLGGIAFLFDHPIEADTRVIVMLANPTRAFSKLASLRVTHCQEQENNQHHVGGEFAHRLSDEELGALLA